MEPTRDLGRIELWEESLERSLARRGKLTRSSPELSRVRPQNPSSGDSFEKPRADSRARRRAVARRPGVLVPVIFAGGALVFALLSVTVLPSVLGGGGRQVAAAASGQRFRGRVSDRSPRPTSVHPTTVGGPLQSARKPSSVHHAEHKTTHPESASTPADPKQRKSNPNAPWAAPHDQHSPAPTPPAPPPSGYVNPLAHARVTPERIDQGVDYAGTGTLTAVGEARITHVGTSDTGWPGTFIEYRLLDGPDAGRYVYYAEGVRPARGIHVGASVQAGHAVAQLIPGWSSGIEIGWGAGSGTETYAHKHGEYTYPTASGESFSALVASLGGPPGRA